jgi:hypothetical protein
LPAVIVYNGDHGENQSDGSTAMVRYLVCEYVGQYDVPRFDQQSLKFVGVANRMV